MKIAIIRKDLGNYSETFVRKNIDSLNGGQTVVIADRLALGHAWKPDQPTLYLSHYPKPLRSYVVRAFLKRHQVEGAVCEFLDYAIDWVPVLTRLDIPFVALGHGYDIGRNLKRFPDYKKSLLSLKAARKIIVPCAYAKEVLLKKAAFDPDFIESIPVGIDLGAFPSPDLTRVNNKILSVGRFVEKKSPVCLLLAFYHAARMVPDIILDCIGDGPLLPEAKRLVRSLGIEAKVNFLGSKPHQFVIAAMKTVRATIQHSVTAENGDMETMPLSIQESIASGTPAVVTNHAGLPDIVKDNVNGFVVAERDFIHMGEKIAHLLTMDPAAYRTLQLNCLHEAKRFDYRTRIHRIETLLGIRADVLDSALPRPAVALASPPPVPQASMNS